MPWLREAALILAIHSLRMSRLRARRSRYAYSSACMTASLAGRKSVRCVIRKPLARFRIFLCRRRAGTLRLTRGISGLVLHIGGRAAQTPGILTGQHEQLAVLALAARALVAQQVALLRVRAHDAGPLLPGLTMPCAVWGGGRGRSLSSRRRRAGRRPDHDHVPAFQQRH